LSLAGVEPQIAQNLGDTARARYLAESGIEWAFKHVAASPIGTTGVFDASLFAGPESVQRLPSRSDADGVYSVTVRNDNLAGDDMLGGAPVARGDTLTDRTGLVIVTSRGTYGSATRTIQVVIGRIGPPPFPGAVNIAGQRAELFLGSASSTSADRVDI